MDFFNHLLADNVEQSTLTDLEKLIYRNIYDLDFAQKQWIVTELNNAFADLHVPLVIHEISTFAVIAAGILLGEEDPMYSRMISDIISKIEPVQALEEISPVEEVKTSGGGGDNEGENA
ncbi:MAG: hypothetical protein KA998_02655 [Rickettsiaceae bacterium]|nr:hypothetical protein [Rickettsiaceae bacterium]